MEDVYKRQQFEQPVLKEVDISGINSPNAILMLFSSNIPYYVGPVGNGSKTGWAKIQESGQVLPWNMEMCIRDRSYAG